MINEEKRKEPKLSKSDPDFYSKIRARRKVYPKHAGQFNEEKAKEAGSKGGKKSKKPKAKRIPRA